MPQSGSKEWFRQGATLSQQLASKIPIYQKLAGADPETSTSIAILKVFGEHGLIDLNDPGFKLIMSILNAKRQALFATSERVNEITKMGMQMPRGETIISEFEEEE
ncbi:unnamed protein product [marine sediment metagenome]|uniref:Uncharacterized protein n=1 Tax=marine sediment metagenome TaxID=412755 RepID=X1IX10_9ZZZZ